MVIDEELEGVNDVMSLVLKIEDVVTVAVVSVDDRLLLVEGGADELVALSSVRSRDTSSISTMVPDTPGQATEDCSRAPETEVTTTDVTCVYESYGKLPTEISCSPLKSSADVSCN